MESEALEPTDAAAAEAAPGCGDVGGNREPSADANTSGDDGSGSSLRRRRRSRWDTSSGDPNCGDGNPAAPKRRSRWEEPNPETAYPFLLTGDLDPEVQSLNARYLEISRLLTSGLPLDDRPEGARSPSPEPIYDNLGVRINTREYRARERLNKERQEIISELIRRNPSFKPPADYRPPKLQKKLYIPMKEYPGYNFIGLIIGPRGNTQKRMEKETGAKIVIRGKGSVKEGKWLQKRDVRPDPSENEDLHVLVEADTQEALDAAAGMVEKLLSPVDEVLNEHKRQQLRELAALNGTIKDEEACRICGEPGHRQFACPAKTNMFKSDVLCKICGDGGHPTIDCPVKGTTGKKMDDEYQNFLAELGGSGPDSLTKSVGATLAIQLGGISGTSTVSGPDTSTAGVLNSFKKEYDEANLYVGYLPPTFDDPALTSLFSSFGQIVMAKVIKDRITGQSKGYGFVKYADVAQANAAIASMNGYCLEGRTIAVRVAGKPPQPAVPSVPPSASVLPQSYSLPNSNASGYPPQQYMAGAALAPPPPPPGSYAPVPWAPPPYAPYPPPPPGSSVYMLAAPPYGAPCPPPLLPPTSTPGTAPQPQTPTSEGSQNYPPGVQPPLPSIIPAQPAHPGPSMYPTLPYGYAPYYSVVPPPPPATAEASESITSSPWTSSVLPPPPTVVDPSHSIATAPWASSALHPAASVDPSQILARAPLASSLAHPDSLTGEPVHSIASAPWSTHSALPLSSQPPSADHSADSEYAKFMSEMK